MMRLMTMATVAGAMALAACAAGERRAGPAPLAPDAYRTLPTVHGCAYSNEPGHSCEIGPEEGGYTYNKPIRNGSRKEDGGKSRTQP